MVGPQEATSSSLSINDTAVMKRVNITISKIPMGNVGPIGCL